MAEIMAISSNLIDVESALAAPVSRRKPYPPQERFRRLGRRGSFVVVWLCGFDFNILTAFIRLGRARPVRGGVPSIFIRFIGIVPSK